MITAEIVDRMPHNIGCAVRLIRDADLEVDVDYLQEAWHQLTIHQDGGARCWLRLSCREALRRAAAENDSAVRARLFVLIAEGNLTDALTTLDSLIGQADATN